MSFLRRTLLPALLALALVAELVVGLVGAGNLRADQRRADAIAKERHAVAAYRKQLTPILLQVYDVVQPLQDTSDAFSTPSPGLTDARDDVITHTAASATLHALATQLKGLKAPKSLTKTAKELDVGIGALITAADKLVAATKAPGDKTGFVAAYGSAYNQLTAGEDSWLEAVEGAFGGQATQPTPAEDGEGAHGHNVPTHGGYILAADKACGQAYQDEDLLPAGKTDAEEIARLPKEIAVEKVLNAKLQAIQTPPSQAQTLGHQVQTLLKAELNTLPPALTQLLGALKAQDVNAFKAAQAKFALALPTLRDLSHAYKSYGVGLCADFYDVTDLLSGKSGGGTTQST